MWISLGAWKGIRPLRFIPIFFLCFIAIGLPLVSAIYISDDITFVPENGNSITTNFNFISSKIYLDSSFIMFENMKYGKNSYPLIGFSSLTTDATITIIDANVDELKITVNAPTGITSTTKIYIPSKGKPYLVVGCSSWSYSRYTKTITLKVKHSSPSNVVISWSQSDKYQQEFKSSAYGSYALLGMVVVVMSASLCLAALSGNLTGEMMVELIVVSIFIPIGFYILVSILEAF